MGSPPPPSSPLCPGGIFSGTLHTSTSRFAPPLPAPALHVLLPATESPHHEDDIGLPRPPSGQCQLIQPASSIKHLLIHWILHRISPVTPQGEEMSGPFHSQEPHCPQHPRKVPSIPGRSQKSQSSTQSLDAGAGRSCGRKEGVPKSQHGQMQGELRTILHPREAVPGATKPGTGPRSKVPVRTQDPESLCPGMSNSRVRHFPNRSGKGRFLLGHFLWALPRPTAWDTPRP